MKIILYHVEHPGNIGAVARVMANFGFSELVLVRPACDHLCEEARKRAKHAREVLEQALVVETLDQAGCDWIAGTSGKIGADDNLARLPLTPSTLSKKALGERCGILFGPESSGLSNEELESCDVFVHIPTSEEYPVMNLSHAVAILLYELARSTKKEFTPLPAHEKEVLQGLINQAIDSLPFETEEKRTNQKMIWKRLVGKAQLTRREAHGVMGLFKKMLGKR